MSTENNIHLRGRFDHDEIRAADTISPGMLVELDVNGEVVPHSTEGGFAMRTIAEIDALQGNTKDDDYVDDDLVFVNIEMPGNDTQMFLTVGEDVAKGDKLISAGDGNLIANGSEDSLTTVEQIIGVAQEALDLTVSGAVTKLMKVRLL